MNFKCKLYDLNLIYEIFENKGRTRLSIYQFDRPGFLKLTNNNSHINFNEKFRINSSAVMAIGYEITWLPGWEDYKINQHYCITHNEPISEFYKRIESFKKLTLFINKGVLGYKRKDIL